MQLLIYLLSFIVAIGVIVTVHEFGHYWVAKKLGVKVLRFSVGFGNPIYTRIAGNDQTEYVLASIPLGGYVKMLDEREGDVRSQDLHRAFNRQTVWKRFAIVFAGPAFNFIFAVFAYWMTFVAGVEGTKPTVGEVASESIAAYAEINPKDYFVEVEGSKVSTWQQTTIELLDHALKKGNVQAVVEDEDKYQRSVTLDLSDTKHLLSEGNLLEKIGILPWRYAYPPVFGELNDGPAKSAGILSGDRVLSVDGKEMASWTELASYIRAHPGEAIRLNIQRDSTNIVVKVVPAIESENGEKIGRVGAYPFIDQELIDQQRVIVSFGPFEAISKSFAKTWDVSILTLKLLWKLIVGDASLKNISGPVTIAEYAGVSAAIGFSAFVGALAIISISIGILNLLPIPVLDGGHLFYYIIEIIKGSPVSERIEALGQRIGIVLLAGLMCLAFYNDIYRLLQ